MITLERTDSALLLGTNWEVGGATGEQIGRGTGYDERMDHRPADQQKILLFCDSEKLARAIELTIRVFGAVETRFIDQISANPIQFDDKDLIVMAISRPTREGDMIKPLETLQVFMLKEIPVLLISDSTEKGEFGNHEVIQMQFPFVAQTLYDQVHHILNPNFTA